MTELPRNDVELTEPDPLELQADPDVADDEVGDVDLDLPAGEGPQDDEADEDTA